MEMRRNNSAEPREEVGAIIICERASRIRTAPQKGSHRCNSKGARGASKEGCATESKFVSRLSLISVKPQVSQEHFSRNAPTFPKRNRRAGIGWKRFPAEKRENFLRKRNLDKWSSSSSFSSVFTQIRWWQNRRKRQHVNNDDVIVPFILSWFTFLS